MKILKPIIWIIVIIAVVGGVYIVFKSLNNSADNKLVKLNDEIAHLKNTVVPIKYKVKKQNDDMLTVVVKFMDLDSNVIAKEKFELKGTTVSFDFMVAKFKNGYVAFPYKIFTDQIAAEDGILLYKYYEKNNYPQVYFSKNSKKAFRDGIEVLYDKIRKKDIEDLDVFGSMVQNHPSASGRINNNTYKIIVHTKGGLEIQKD